MALSRVNTLKVATAGSGYVIDLRDAGGNAAGYVKARPRVTAGEFYIKPVYSPDTAPDAPAATPAPASDAQAAWYHVITGDDPLVLGQEFAKGFNAQAQDAITHLLVWAVAAGELVTVAH